MQIRTAGAVALAAVLGLGGLTASVQAVPAAHAVASEQAAPGLVRETWTVRGASAAVHVARRDAGSPVRLQVVQAHDAVARGPETTTAMCRRTAGCRLAVNGDFFTTDGSPLGAVVVDGRMLRSPVPTHEQLSLEPLRATAPGLGEGGWSGEVRLPDGRPPLRLSGVNRGLAGGQLVLYTSSFGASTPPCTCLEVRLAEQDERAGTLGRSVRVRVTGQSAGGSPLAPGTAVLAGEGAAAEDLRALLAAPGPLVLTVATAAPTRHNVGVHPVLLRGGQPAAYGRSDPMLAEPHPRTLVGWDARGTTWLVAAEGRRRGAPGLTAAQAVRFLQRLGATDAVMLDGGGSTSFVSRGELVSRPSDGTERPVANALVLSWEQPEEPAPAPAVAVQSAASPAPVAEPGVAAAAAPPAPAAPAPTTPTTAPSSAPAAAPEPVAPSRAALLRRLPPVGEPPPAGARPPAAAAAPAAPAPSPAVAQLVAVALLATALGAWLHVVRRYTG